MKCEAKQQLIKDLLLAGIAWVVASLIFATVGELGVFGIFPGLFAAGVPFGWRWLSKIIVAVSLQGIALKLVGAIFLGFIAIFVVLIGDIIRYKTAED